MSSKLNWENLTVTFESHWNQNGTFDEESFILLRIDSILWKLIETSTKKSPKEMIKFVIRFPSVLISLIYLNCFFFLSKMSSVVCNNLICFLYATILDTNFLHFYHLQTWMLANLSNPSLCVFFSSLFENMV